MHSLNIETHFKGTFVRGRGSILYLGMATEILIAKEATNLKPSMQRELYRLVVHKNMHGCTLVHGG